MPTSIERTCIAPPFTWIHTLCLSAVCLKVILLDCLLSLPSALILLSYTCSCIPLITIYLQLFLVWPPSFLPSIHLILSFLPPMDFVLSFSPTLISLLLIFLLFYHHQTFLAGIIGTNVANMSLWIHGRTTKNLNWQIESSIKKWLALVRTCYSIIVWDYTVRGTCAF